MKLWKVILNLIFPPRCILCRKILADQETDLCRCCREETEEFPFCPENKHPSGKSRLQFLDSFTAVWYYEENVRRSILRYKFHRARNYAPAYGRMLAMKLLRDCPDDADLITWVPVSRLRKLRRGYDQSQLLAEAVGRELGMETVPLLKKIRHNPPQSGTSGEKRKANVLGAYAAVNTSAGQGKRVFLIDDVFTTGATAEECARVLLTAGVREVHCGVIAAAQKHENKPSR